MEDNKKFELSDEALDAVSGGTGEGTDIIVDGTACKTTDFTYWSEWEWKCNNCGIKTTHDRYRFQPATGSPGVLYVCKICGKPELVTRTVM